MANDPITPPEYGVPDDENPELTGADFARARPFAEVFPEIAAAARNKGGRPKVAEPKVHVGLRLPSALATWLRGDGTGYNARAQAILQRAMDEAIR